MTSRVSLLALVLGLIASGGACRKGVEGDLASTSQTGGAQGTIGQDEQKYLPGNAKPVGNNNPQVQDPNKGNPTQQVAANACDDLKNEHISIGGYEAWLEKSPLGRMNVRILQSGTVTLIGQPCAVFDGVTATDNDAETGCGGNAVYYHGGMVRSGETVWGSLTIDRESSGKYVNVILDGGKGTVRVGSLRSSTPGASTTIDFNAGACMVRYHYKTKDGAFFSGGQGYILIP